MIIVIGQAHDKEVKISQIFKEIQLRHQGTSLGKMRLVFKTRQSDLIMHTNLQMTPFLFALFQV